MKGFGFLLFLTLMIVALNGTYAATKKVNITKNYYLILGLEKGAKSTEEEIKNSFRKLALKFHPDVAKDKKTAEEKFKEINEAYEVVSDPELKKLYDDLRAFPTSAPIVNKTEKKRSYTVNPVKDPFRWQYEYEMVALIIPSLVSIPLLITLSYILNVPDIRSFSIVPIIASMGSLVFLKRSYTDKKFVNYSPRVKNILRNPMKAGIALAGTSTVCFAGLIKLASLAF